MSKTILSDKSEDAGGPHWLSPAGRKPQGPPRSKEEIRQAARARWLGAQEARRRREKAFARAQAALLETKGDATD